MRALFVAAVVLLSAGTALAQTGAPTETELAEDEARGLFNAGFAAYEAGRYDDALRYFERAHEISGRPQLLFNVAQCYDRLRHDEQAIATFERYLEALPTADNRIQVEARIRALREGIARRQTVVPTPAEVAASARTTESPNPAVTTTDSNPHRGRRIALATTGGVVAVAAVVLTVLLVRGGGDDYAPSPVGTVFALGGGRR